MILHCPGCKARLRLAENFLVPGADIWIKCPSCNERFRPVSNSLDDLNLPPDSATEHAPTQTGRISNVVGRIKIQDFQDGVRKSIDLEALPVLPEDPPKNTRYLVLTIILVSGLLVLLALSFNYAVAPQPAIQPNAGPQVVARYEDYSLASDLLALRKDLLRFRQVERDINYRGRETRIYKYYLETLAPDLCQNIVSLKIWSPRTIDGFRLRAECLEKRTEPAEIVFSWNTETVTINVEGRDLKKTITLTH
jgi:hypothetical protein